MRRAVQVIVGLFAVVGVFAVGPDAWAYFKYYTTTGSTGGDHCVGDIENQLREQFDPVDYEHFATHTGYGFGFRAYALRYGEEERSAQALETHAILKSAVNAGEVLPLNQFANVVENGYPDGFVYQVEIVYRERTGTDRYGLRRATTILYDTRHCIHGYIWIEQLTGAGNSADGA